MRLHHSQIGFDIEPIRQLLALSGHPTRSCAGADAIARTHLADIDHKIARLTALRSEVARMTECASSDVADWRVIEVLGDHGECLDAHAPGKDLFRGHGAADQSIAASARRR